MKASLFVCLAVAREGPREGEGRKLVCTCVLGTIVRSGGGGGGGGGEGDGGCELTEK